MYNAARYPVYHDDHYKSFPIEEPVHFSPTKVSAAFQFQIPKSSLCDLVDDFSVVLLVQSDNEYLYQQNRL